MVCKGSSGFSREDEFLQKSKEKSKLNKMANEEDDYEGDNFDRESGNNYGNQSHKDDKEAVEVRNKNLKINCIGTGRRGWSNWRGHWR